MRHDGTVDSDRVPDYTTPGTWDTYIEGWPCEILTVSNGETLRGQQVTAETTHLFVGEYHGAKDTTTDMRVEVGDVTYEIISAYDPHNDRRDFWVETKIQQ